MKIKTDQSNASYNETSPTTANLIGQFGFSFFRDGTSNLKLTVCRALLQAFVEQLWVGPVHSLMSTHTSLVGPPQAVTRGRGAADTATVIWGPPHTCSDVAAGKEDTAVMSGHTCTCLQ